ncbi:MAG: protein BatD [bacterium]|nr:protein BatD [bacterium]
MRRTGNRFSPITRTVKAALSVLLVLALVSLWPLTAQNKGDIEIKASIGADKIGLDDVLLYTVTFKGINNPVQPDLSELKNFKVAQSSRSTEFRFVNGVSTYYTNFIYYLTPLDIGTFRLPPVTYQHQGRDYKTRPFTVEVVAGSVAPRQNQQRQRRRFPSVFDQDDFFSSPFKRSRPETIDILIVPEVSTKTAVTGQQVIFRVILYTLNRIRSVNMVSNQSIPGFWQEWFPVNQSIEGQSRVLNGKRYQAFEIRKAALFPNKSGALSIPPLKFELGLAGDAFSVFSNPRTIVRSTRALTLQVKDIPGEAAGLPVGRFKLSVRPAKNQVDVNDILTLKIKISGRGNIKTLTPPEFKSDGDFKVYPSKITRDLAHQDLGVSGSVESEVPVAFKSSGAVSFPPLEFKYFDPDRSKVVSLNSRPFTIDVSGTKEKQAGASTVPRTEIIKTGEDIDFIKKGSVYSQDGHIYTGGIFVFILLVPFLVNLLLILKLFVFDRYITNSPLLKQRKLLNRTIKALQNVREPGEISPLIESYLKEKAGLGLSAITNQGIDQLLGRYGVADTDIKTIIRLKSESESWRFSPNRTSALNGDSGRQLQQSIHSLIEVLKRIDGRIK